MKPEDERTVRAVKASLDRYAGPRRILRLDCCDASKPSRRNELVTTLKQSGEVWEPFIRMFAGPLIWDLRSRVEIIARKCESPIEEMLFLALLVAGQQRTDSKSIDDMISGANPAPFDCWSLVTVSPQFVVGRYRVDFRVVFHGTLRALSPDGEFVERDGKKWLDWHRGEVLVESDGHDFHERTKEQASADKRKDRDLQAAGFTIFRYTGSDVWQDCMAAAEEVVDMAWQRACESPRLAEQEDAHKPRV